MRPWGATSLLLVTGCTPGFSDVHGPSRSFGPYDDAALEDHAERGPAGPCAGGTWGRIDLPKEATHVRTWGSDLTGDGSAARPYRSLQRAVNHVGNGGPNNLRVAIGPGMYPTRANIQPSPEFPLQQWLTIEGCGAGETRLVARDSLDSVVRVAGSRGVALQGVTIEGGRRAVRVQDAGVLRLYDSEVVDAQQVGILAHDPYSEVVLRDTDVYDTAPVGNMGWGIAVLDGALHMTRGSVYDSAELGIFADAAALTLTDIEVRDTAPSGRFDSLGRGIHLQTGSDLTMTGGYICDNADAGIFLLDPGEVVINGLVIDITGAGIVIDFPSTGFSGDGIVVSGGQNVEIYDSLVSDSARAALLLDASSAVLAGNHASDSGLNIGGLEMFTQAGGTASGDDASDVMDLVGPLLLNDWVLSTADVMADP